METQHDPFDEYRKQYPRLDIDEEYKRAKAKCEKYGDVIGKKYFESWLKVADRDFLEIPERLQPKPRSGRYYNDQFPPEPLTREEMEAAYERRSGSSSGKTS
jgi:hypothetical protein